MDVSVRIIGEPGPVDPHGTVENRQAPAEPVRQLEGCCRGRDDGNVSQPNELVGKVDRVRRAPARVGGLRDHHNGQSSVGVVKQVNEPGDPI